MTEIKEKSIEQILEDLSYSFASPEAKKFMTAIGEKNYHKAEAMLLTKIDAAEANLVINHFKNEVEKKFKLIEMTYEDFKIKYPYNPNICSDEIVDEIVINYRGHIASSYLMKARYDEPQEWYILITNRVIKVKDVDQIWFIEKK